MCMDMVLHVNQLQFMHNHFKLVASPVIITYTLFGFMQTLAMFLFVLLKRKNYHSAVIAVIKNFVFE